MDQTMNNGVNKIESQLSDVRKTPAAFVQKPPGPYETEGVDDKVEHAMNVVTQLSDCINQMVAGENNMICRAVHEIRTAAADLRAEVERVSKHAKGDAQSETSESSGSSSEVAGLEEKLRAANQATAKAEKRAERAERAEKQAIEAEEQVAAARAECIAEMENAAAIIIDEKDVAFLEHKGITNQIMSEKENAYKDELEVFVERQIEATNVWKGKCEKLFNQLQGLKSNIRVMCRIRPAPRDTPAEELVEFGERLDGDAPNKWGKMVIPTSRTRADGSVVERTKEFDFERVFGADDTNEDVFDEVNDLVQSALNFQKVSMLCYGQSGSGKTHTMSYRANPDEVTEADGIIPRALALILDEVETLNKINVGKYTFFVDMSVVEIYLKHTYDLLLKPQHNEKTDIQFIHRASWVELDSWKLTNAILDKAQSHRAVGATSLNDQSSRSHLILSLRISRKTTRKTTKGALANSSGQLTLVDLAGSERAKNVGTEGAQFAEGVEINKSLLSLNGLIKALADGSQPSYDHALTKALRPCFSMDCKTLMFVMVSPFKTNFDISMTTLERGQDATRAKLAAVQKTKRQVLHVAREASTRSPGSNSSTPQEMICAALSSSSFSSRQEKNASGLPKVPLRNMQPSVPQASGQLTSPRATTGTGIPQASRMKPPSSTPTKIQPPTLRRVSASGSSRPSATVGRSTPTKPQRPSPQSYKIFPRDEAERAARVGKVANKSKK